MSQPLNAHMYALSDKGLRRKKNEDRFFCSRKPSIAMVADGMGGANAGEVASALVVKLVGKKLRNRLISEEDSPDIGTVQGIIMDAHQSIRRMSKKQPHLKGMGSTLVMGLFLQREALLAHVGDSRIYRWRDAKLTQMTRDHTVAERMLQKHGPDCQIAPKYYNLLTQSMGASKRILPNIQTIDLQEEDIFLFCSDGLLHTGDDSILLHALENDANKRLKDIAAHLVREANERGGPDNSTVVLVQMRRVSPLKQMLGLLGGWMER